LGYGRSVTTILEKFMAKTTMKKIDGLPVKNIEKRIRLVISAADCRRGKSKLPNACAAALAAKRQVPHCVEARIHINRAYLRVGKHWLRGRVNSALRTEIATFDKGGTFEPGIYDIIPLCPSERPTGKRTGGPFDDKNRPKPRKKMPWGRSKIIHQLVGIREGARSEYRPKRPK
jgi:hypothetical protein